MLIFVLVFSHFLFFFSFLQSSTPLTAQENSALTDTFSSFAARFSLASDTDRLRMSRSDPRYWFGLFFFYCCYWHFRPLVCDF